MYTQEIHKKLADIGDVLAHILDPDHKESGLEIAVLKTSDTATSLKTTLGNKMGFINLQNPGDT